MQRTDWRDKVAECRSSGMSATDWCTQGYGLCAYLER